MVSMYISVFSSPQSSNLSGILNLLSYSTFNRDIRILWEFTRYRFKLMSCNRSEKNRFQNAFTVCHVALDSVVYDIFSKSVSGITNYLVTSDSFDPDTCKAFLLRSLKKKVDVVVESIESCQMEDSQIERILLIRSHVEFVEKPLQTLDSSLDEIIAPYENAISLLCIIHSRS